MLKILVLYKTIQLTYYNVCKWSPQDDVTATQTPNVGTASFRAPEVLLFRDDGKTHYGTPSDIWAVGVLVFQIWTNEHFASEREVRIRGLAHIIKSRITTISEEGMQRACRVCLVVY